MKLCFFFLLTASSLLSAQNIELKINQGHSRLKEVRFINEGQRIISSSGERVKIWDFSTAKELVTIEDTIGLYGSLQLSKTGKYLAHHEKDTIEIFTLPDKRLIKSIHKSRSKLSEAFDFPISPEFINADKYFCYESNNKLLALDLLKGTNALEIKLDEDIPNNSEIHWYKDQIFLRSRTMGVVAYNLQNGEKSYPLDNIPDNVNNFWIVGDKIFFLHKNRQISCWNLTTGVNFFNYQNQNTHVETEIHFLNNKNLLLIGDVNGLVKVVQQNGEDSILVSNENLGSIVSIESSWNEKYFLVGFSNGEIRVWNSHNLSQEKVLQGFKTKINIVDFLSDTELLLAVNYNNIQSHFIFNLESSEISSTGIEGFIRPNSVGMGADVIRASNSKKLLSTFKEDSTFVYEIPSLRLLEKIPIARKNFTFSDDLAYVVDFSWDEGKHIVKIIDLKTDSIEEFRTKSKFRYSIPIRFSSDNQFIVFESKWKYYTLNKKTKSIDKIKDENLVHLDRDGTKVHHMNGDFIFSNPLLSSDILGRIPIKNTVMNSLYYGAEKDFKFSTTSLSSLIKDVTLLNNNYVKIDYYNYSELLDLSKGTHVYGVDKPYFSTFNKNFTITPDSKTLVTSSEGKLDFYSLSDTLTHLTSLQFTSDTDWMVIDSKGLFDSSPRAMKDVYFVADGEEIIEMEQLKSRYYEPNLLQKRLGFNKEDIREIKGIKGVKLYPDMKLLHPEFNNGVLGIELVNRGGGIGRIQIKINGKEAVYDAKGNMRVDNDSLFVKYKIENHPFLKSDEVNIISVRVFNKGGYLSSREKNLYYRSSSVKEETIPTLFGIIIGTSDYRGEELDLKYASKDAKDFAKALTLVGERYFGNDNVKIELLNTSEENDSRPTKESIYKLFEEIGSKANAEDVLVVYLSGHGTNYGGDDADFYYLTVDANSGNLSDPIIRNNVAISSSEFVDLIKGIPALKQIMIIDACHSGRLAEDIMVARSDRPSSEIRALERLKDRTGTYILAGSAADAVSYETSVYGQGLLTYSLLFGLKGAALRDDKFVDVMQLFQFAADEVPNLAANIGGIQKPEIRIPYEAQSFDIGIVDDEIKDQIKLPSPKPLFVRSNFMNGETFNDDLRITDSVDEQLKNFSISRGDQPELVFIDVARFSDAYSLKGQYKIENGITELEFRLFLGEEVLTTFKVQGNQKREIVSDVIKVSMDYLSQYK